MELVLIRHGRSVVDDLNKVEGAGCDAPLTREGIRQAKLKAFRVKFNTAQHIQINAYVALTSEFKDYGTEFTFLLW